jgi:hypothetical protein
MAIGTSGVSVPSMGQTIDSSIYGNKEAPKGMSLSDIVDLSRSSTALQKEKLGLQKEQELLQPSIEAGKAASKQAVAQADTAQLENNIKHVNNVIQSQQRLLTKPDLTADDVIKSVKEHAKNAGTSDQQVNQALQGLPVGGNAADLRSWLAMSLSKTLSAQSQLEKLYPGGILPGQLPSSYKPETQEQPRTTAQEPFSQPEKLSYPVPVAGQPRAQLPSEEGDRAFGEKTRISLTNFQSNYGVIRQNYDKLIDQTEKVAENTIFGGAAGTAERKLKSKFGTPEYQQLSKDLAKAQIAQIEASGGDLASDAGKSLAGYANGKEYYDPDVLIGIARRNAAEIENKNMRANGTRVFSEKNGDANVKHFNSMWNKNANDNAVFEMKYIFSHAKTPEEGTAQVAKYIKESGLTPKKRKELATKYLNLQKLETTGTL